MPSSWNWHSTTHQNIFNWRSSSASYLEHSNIHVCLWPFWIVFWYRTFEIIIIDLCDFLTYYSRNCLSLDVGSVFIISTNIFKNFCIRKKLSMSPRTLARTSNSLSLFLFFTIDKNELFKTIHIFKYPLLLWLWSLKRVLYYTYPHRPERMIEWLRTYLHNPLSDPLFLLNVSRKSWFDVWVCLQVKSLRSFGTRFWVETIQLNLWEASTKCH